MEEITLKVKCDSEEQAGLLKDLLLKVVPQFEGKIYIEHIQTVDKFIDKQKKEWQEMRKRGAGY